MNEAVGMMNDWPKASIGNYKGVMLCNRPNEFGQQKRDTGGNMPFKSQVHIETPLGWNPTQKLQPKVQKRKLTNGILLKHKLFIKDLENKKQEDPNTADCCNRSQRWYHGIALVCQHHCR